jgi:hypothetical protein
LLLIELAELINKEFKGEIKISIKSNETYLPSTKKNISKTTYSNQRIKSLIKFNPISISEGLFKMIKELKN